jgi:hypothetical protein
MRPSAKNALLVGAEEPAVSGDIVARPRCPNGRYCAHFFRTDGRPGRAAEVKIL